MEKGTITIEIRYEKFIRLVKSIRRENIEKEEKLGQVRYMLEVEKKLFDAYRKPEMFLEALRQVAVTMTAEQVYCLILDGMDLSRMCWWNKNRGMECGKLPDFCIKREFAYLSSKIREEGSRILIKIYRSEDYSEEKKEMIWLFQKVNPL